jgi:imidazolonepropionase-like amidohydrolase
VWPRIEANRPDFLKIILSYSEDFERLRSDTTIQPWYRGLDPRLVPPIVERAHGVGLKVAAHVMSAHDFEVAIDAGVDIIAHMPGFAPGAAFTPEQPHPYLANLTPDSPRYRISAASAERAEKQGGAVITTLIGDDLTDDKAAAANIALLRSAGVTLLIGSDAGELTSVDEAVFLVESGMMPAGEVLRSLTMTTPRFFFAGRRIGELTPGAEATFVVLARDPLTNIRALQSVVSVTQRGHLIHTALEP